MLAPNGEILKFKGILHMHSCSLFMAVDFSRGLTMRFLSVALITAASISVFPQMASAADMPMKAPVAPAPVYNWTGLYVGAGVGYGMYNVESEGITPTGVINSTNQTAGGRGWFGTLVGGYDYQFSGPFVAGVFADVDFSDIKGRLADTYEEGTAPLKQQWAWAVGGRIGYLATPTVLSYINGGFTQAHFAGGAFANFNGAPTPLSLGSETFNGWFLGGGIETMLFSGFSLRTEYRFADYETRDIPFNGTTFSGDVNHESSHPFVQTVRTDLIYKFNSAQMAASYAAVPSSVYNWTGIYVGGGFGYGMFNLDNSWLENGQIISTDRTAGGRGWLGKVGGGFDYQFNNRIVAGVFADADFSNIKGTLSDPYEEETFPVKQQWAWAAGGRVGYLIVPSVLSYFNGGFTQAHFSGGLSTQSGGQPGFDTLSSQTYNGWFLGSGLELMVLPGWFVRTEYRFAEYETRDVFVSFTPSGGGFERIRPFVQTASTELIYKFNFGK